MKPNLEKEKFFYDLIQQGEIIVESNGMVYNKDGKDIRREITSKKEKPYLEIVKKYKGKLYHIMVHRLKGHWLLNLMSGKQLFMKY